MSKDPLAHPDIVSRAEWTAARKALLEEEKAFTKQRDALNARRRRLPMVRVEKDYRFHTPDGEKSLLDLFDGKRQLWVQHFMFHPDWEDGCPSCTHLADEISGMQVRHLADSDMAFVMVSRAPLEKLERWRKKRGWTHRWVSSKGSDFNYDFHVTLNPAVAPVTYNFKSREVLESDGMSFEDGKAVEVPGSSLFLRVGDDVFHTYSTFARGGEAIGGSHYMLDLSAYGRQQDFEDSPEGWPQEPTYG